MAKQCACCGAVKSDGYRGPVRIPTAERCVCGAACWNETIDEAEELRREKEDAKPKPKPRPRRGDPWGF